MASQQIVVLGVVRALSSWDEFNNRCYSWPGIIKSNTSDTFAFLLSPIKEYTFKRWAIKGDPRKPEYRQVSFCLPSLRRRMCTRAGTQGWPCWSTSAISSSPSTRLSTSLSMLSRSNLAFSIPGNISKCVHIHCDLRGCPSPIQGLSNH